MEVVSIDRRAPGAKAWPEGAGAAAVERCLAVVEARDPLSLPADEAVVAAAPFLAVALGSLPGDGGASPAAGAAGSSRADGGPWGASGAGAPAAEPAGPSSVSGAGAPAAAEVLGVAWRRETADGWLVDVRVRPGLRRRGLGSALLSAVAADAGPLVAGCDAAHPRVRRFLTGRGFTLAELVFHQRWDGDPRDVPPAFSSAELTEPADPAFAVALLRAAAAGTRPFPAVTTEEAAAGHRRVAWRDARPAGALVAHREADAWEVDGLAVAPEHRGLGVGRGLLADLMRRAAAEGLGVTLRVAQAAPDTLAFTQKLGFWTFRTWALYRRETPS